MTWLAFLAVALGILLAGRQVAFYGDVLSEKTGLGRTFMGLFLVGFTSSLPELFNVTSAALQGLPDIAVGNLLGASMVNFLLLTVLVTLKSSGRLVGIPTRKSPIKVRPRPVFSDSTSP